jgi:hypothetical protein
MQCRRVQMARRRASCDEAAAPLQAATEHGKLPRSRAWRAGIVERLGLPSILLVAPHEIMRKETAWSCVRLWMLGVH